MNDYLHFRIKKRTLYWIGFWLVGVVALAESVAWLAAWISTGAVDWPTSAFGWVLAFCYYYFAYLAKPARPDPDWEKIADEAYTIFVLLSGLTVISGMDNEIAANWTVMRLDWMGKRDAMKKRKAVK